MDKEINFLKDIDKATLKKISNHVAKKLVEHGIMPEDQAQAFAQSVIINQDVDTDV